MAAERDPSPRKLVYLRDHTPRPRLRARRPDRRRAGAAPPPELAAEAAWLGRFLIAAGAFTLLYWLALAVGAVLPEGEEAWRWTLSHGLAHLFLAASAAMAGRLLLQGGARAPLFVAVAAGALLVTALEGLTRMVVAGGMADISLGARSDILTKSAVLALGIWSASYALRADRRVA